MNQSYRKLALMVLLAVLALTVSTGSLLAGEKGHYVPGVEGIKAASLPPPGVYWRSYNIFYNSSSLRDGNGDELPVNFDVSVFATANRFIWMTDKKVLGGFFGVDAIIPLVSTDIKIGAMHVDDSQFALGDIFFESTLSWHGPRYDVGLGLGWYAPTGKYDKTEPASAGMDFWTTMLTFGATAYLDQGRLWTLSALGRYEINSEKGDTKIKPGQEFLFEYGLSRTVAKIWDLGLSGYCLWQVTDDSGADMNWDASVHDRVFSIGPEASVFIPPAKAFLSLRTLFEAGARDRTQGNTVTVTFTKIF